MAEEFKLSHTAAQIDAKLNKIDSLAEKSELPTKTSDLANDSGFATENYVQKYAQPIGDYALKGEIPSVDLSDYALKSEIPTDYLTEIPEGYVTEEELQNKGFLTEYIETDPSVPAWAKAEKKPTYSAKEVGALPADTVIPVKTSDLVNDSGFITGYSETDPTVPSWAKQPNKPVYTAEEVGALPSSTVVPTKVSELENDRKFLTEYVETDPSVPAWAKSPNKPIYTAEEVGALPSNTVIPTVPTNVSAFTNDAGYLTEHQDLSDYTKKDYVDGALATKQPIGDYALKSDIPTDYLTAIPAEYVTEYELNSKGYLTEQSLDGLATKTYVDEAIENLDIPSGDSTPILDENGKLLDSVMPEGTGYLEGTRIEEVFPVTTVDTEGSTYGAIPEYEFIEGQTYFVTFNGTEYECIAWYDKENLGCAMVGKGTLYSDWVDPSWGEDVPFCLETSYLNVSEAGVYTIGVKTSVDDYHVIPEKYLPPVVGRLGTGKNSEIFNNYDYNIASGQSSHAEGCGTKASGRDSHAEGNNTIASGKSSHAEGYGGPSGMTLYLTGDANATTYTVTEWSPDVIKIGRYVYDSNNGLCKIVSFSEAESTITFDKSINPKIAFNQRLISFRSGIAAGKYSHIEGNNTIAYSESQHVQGRYNLEDFDGKYAHIVGNGQKEALSNAHTIDWDGNAWFAGGLKISGTSQDDVAAKIVATLDDIPSIEGLATEDFVTQQIANLVNSAPDALNTLDELAAALGDDENFATTVTNQIAEKVSKTELTTEVNSALAAAKESGEFDGADGYTPVKGTDYWTEADKAEMVETVRSSIPTFNLTEMGLPLVPIDGTSVIANMDCTAIRNALETGPIKSVFNISFNGQSTPFTSVACGLYLSSDDCWQVSSVATVKYGGNPVTMVGTFNVRTDNITVNMYTIAYRSDIQSYIDSSILGGEW